MSSKPAPLAALGLGWPATLAQTKGMSVTCRIELGDDIKPGDPGTITGGAEWDALQFTPDGGKPCDIRTTWSDFAIVPR